MFLDSSLMSREADTLILATLTPIDPRLQQISARLGTRGIS